MKERKGYSNYLNQGGESLGFNFEDLEENSHHFNRQRQFKEQSLSYKINFNIDESKSNFQFFNFENTINFNQIAQGNRQKEAKFISEKESCDSVYMQQVQSSGQQKDNANSLKKGLKNLTTQLYKIMMQKQGSCDKKIIEQQMQKKLYQGDQKYESLSNQGKNLRRRCYDALNVMKAAGVVQKSKSTYKIKKYIKKKQKGMMKMIPDNLEEIQHQIFSRRIVLERKKQLLKDQKKKLQNVKNWIQAKKEKKSKQQIRESEKLNFPLIIVSKEQEEQNDKEKISIQYVNDTQEYISISGTNLRFIGDLDIIDQYNNFIKKQNQLLQSQQDGQIEIEGIKIQMIQ